MFGFALCVVVLVVAGYFFLFKPGTFEIEVKKDLATVIGGIAFTAILASALWQWWGYSQLPPALANYRKTGFVRMGNTYLMNVPLTKVNLDDQVMGQLKKAAERNVGAPVPDFKVEKVELRVTRKDWPIRWTSPLRFFVADVRYQGKGTPAPVAGVPAPAGPAGPRNIEVVCRRSYDRYDLESILPPCEEGGTTTSGPGGITLPELNDDDFLFSPSYTP
jgi:hypothetical protein